MIGSDEDATSQLSALAPSDVAPTEPASSSSAPCDRAATSILLEQEFYAALDERYQAVSVIHKSLVHQRPRDRAMINVCMRTHNLLNTLIGDFLVMKDLPPVSTVIDRVFQHVDEDINDLIEKYGSDAEVHLTPRKA